MTTCHNCKNFVFCSDPHCTNVHFLFMDYNKRRNAKKITCSFIDRGFLTTERVPTNCKVVRCQSHVVCNVVNCPYYHSGIGIHTRIMWRTAIFNMVLNSPIDPVKRKIPSPPTGPAPKRRLVRRFLRKFTVTPVAQIYSIPEDCEV